MHYEAPLAVMSCAAVVSGEKGGGAEPDGARPRLDLGCGPRMRGAGVEEGHGAADQGRHIVWSISLDRG